MKRILALLLILTLLFAGCDLFTTGNEEPGKLETEEAVEETQEETLPETEEEVAEETSEQGPEEEPTETTEPLGGKLKITPEKSGERYLNAFVDINETPENLSYLEVPKVEGPENLANFVKQRMDEMFYKAMEENWENVVRVQDSKEQDNNYGHLTVFQIKTDVFDEGDTIVVLGRFYSVLGYEMVTTDSRVFYIDKNTGDFTDPQSQMIPLGMTMEDVANVLQHFQQEQNGVEISVEDRAKLMGKDVETKERLAEEHGNETTLIINNFDQPESYRDFDVFLMKEGDRQYIVTKLFLARLGWLINDNFIEEAWVRIPADYTGGKLELKPDSTGQVDYIYE